MYSARLLLRRLEKQGKVEGRGSLLCVLTGVTWPATRLFECGLADTQLCTRCNQGVPDSDYHRVWGCPALSHLFIGHPSQSLALLASEGQATAPVLLAPRHAPRWVEADSRVAR
jgi:hypothetical protein